MAEAQKFITSITHHVSIWLSSHRQPMTAGRRRVQRLQQVFRGAREAHIPRRKVGGLSSELWRGRVQAFAHRASADVSGRGNPRDHWKSHFVNIRTAANMNNASNRTIDPSCTAEPPLAIDIIVKLDIFGIILYSVLTFMATVSMLVFIEECIYIYRKVPAHKKSIIIWVNGAAPVIGTMSCLGMWIPRATMFTDMTSACYFAIVVFKFLTLMLEEVGGDEAFLRRAGKHKLKISTGPCCCCCLCLPYVAITRRSLFLLKLGSFQFALLKIVFTILSIVLYTNGTFDLSDLSITGAAIWINPFVGILTIIALWPVAIMFMHLRTTLRTIKIIPKYAMYQLVLILSQLQTAIINILALNGTIACTPPFSAAARGYMMSQQLLILEMFIITLVTRLLYRRQYDPLPQEEQDDNENTKMAAISGSA